MINFLRQAIERSRFDRRVFFLIYVLVGLPYLILTGPFRAPDERNHFLRSYEISEFRLRPFRTVAGTVGDNLPASLSRLSEALGIHSEHRIEPSQMMIARTLPLRPEQREFTDVAFGVYSPLAYAPSAISIAIGRLAGAGPLALVYFGRSANLLVASWLVACALSYAGYARLPALLISLFPMTVSQIATLTVDAMSYALGFLWVSLVMETALSNPAEAALKRKVALVLLAFALSQLRPPYPLLAVLVFLIPVRRFGKIGAAVVLSAVIAATVVPAAAWNWAAADLFEQPGNGQTVEPRRQLEWVAQHPGIFWHRVKLDLKTRGLDYWQELVGRLGWLNISLPRWIYIGFAAALGLLPFVGPKQPPGPSWWRRIVLAGVVVVGVVAVELLLYLSFNRPNSPFILGVQGRYFTVFAFVAAFACSKPLLDRESWKLASTTACWLFVAFAHGSAWLALARAAGKI